MPGGGELEDVGTARPALAGLDSFGRVTAWRIVVYLFVAFL
jgi:hypothetical protein